MYSTNTVKLKFVWIVIACTPVRDLSQHYSRTVSMNCIMESATDMLVKAVKYDCDNRRVEALSLYTEGINKLLDVAKSINHFC